MAESKDKMVFPIGFDLKAAVDGAIKDWNSKESDRLEEAIQKRALAVKLTVSTKSFDKLDDVKKRLAELKLEPITPETKTAIKELARELRELANALEAVKKYSARVGGTTEAVRNSKIEVNEQKAAATRELARQRAARAALAEEKLQQARLKSADAASNALSKTARLNREYHDQAGYISRLIKRMVVYASISQVGQFLTRVREVTAQFELQRVSLGAIIQDQARANHLFSQIKAFAINSPVKILDLTKYTKQLAAYKIGYDELFETTKRLTDVSVGLGVSMDRVVLAFGQVRATGYLRASEIRQFTEMGVPIVEELAAKLSKMNGEMVTAAQVMDMVSKRAISFEMVKEVFDDMTSAGGIFYNMQEKQGETLYGMWAKLGDAASIMYEEIGNTGFVKGQMEGMIDTLTRLMRNWEATAATLGSIALVGGIAYSSKKAGDNYYDKRLIKATKERVIAQRQLNAVLDTGSDKEKANASAKLANAKAEETKAIQARAQATKTAKFAKGLGTSLKRLASVGLWGAIIGGVTSLAYGLFESFFHANKLKNKLDDIKSDMTDMIGQSTRNFDRLVDIIMTEVDGTKKQKAAIDELNRTYGQMLSAEDLSIENLRRLKEGADGATDAYASLKNAISDYIVAQQKQAAVDEVNAFYDTDIKSWKKNLKDNFEDRGYSLGEYTSFFAVLENLIRDGKIHNKTKDEMGQVLKEMGYDFDIGRLPENTVRQLYATAEALKEINIIDEQLVKSIAYDNGALRSAWINKIIEALWAKENDLKNTIDYFDNYSASLGSLSHVIADVNKKMQNMEYFQLDTEGNKHAIEDGSYLKSRMQANAQIKEWINAIATDPDVKREFEKAGVEIQQEWFSVLERIDLNDFGKISTIDFDAILESLKGKDVPMLRSLVQSIQSEYNNLVPKDPTVREFQEKFKQIVSSFRLSMDDMHRFMWNGSNDIKEYIKTLESQIDNYRKQQKKLQATLLNDSLIGNILEGVMGDSIREKLELLDKQIEALTKMEEFAQTYVPDDKKSKGSKSDTRLQSLQEINQTLEKINKEYNDLYKKEGKSKALQDIKKQFENTLAYTNELGEQFGLHFDFPLDFATLQDYKEAILLVMKSLEDFKGGEKAILEFETNIGKSESEELQKQIENRLKDLSDRISRTKTAKEFYEKILSQTGDFNLAKQLSEKLYDSFGAEANDRMSEYISDLVKNTSAKLDLNIFNADMSFDPQRLRAFAEAEKDALGGIESKAYQELIKLADEADKDFAKTIEGWLKSTKKAETFGSKLTDVYRTTAAEIKKIQTAIDNGRLDKGFGNDLIEDYRRKEAEEVAKLQYEAFKDSPMYVQMFDDLDHASTRMLENMKSRLENMRDNWKNLDPTQLKELQSRLNEIDSQLAKRNPFKTFANGLKELFDLRKNGDSHGNRSRKDADNDVVLWAEEYEKAQKELAKVNADENSTEAQIAGAKQMVDYTQRQKEEAEKVAERWKKAEDAIGLSATELFSMLNWAGDIAQGIADISEAMGADEEDVQYWNDIADALGEISGGIQDIVQAAMSGNVVGIISSTLTAIPKMFVGFTNLFSAGKIKRANKEIKRQQELLDQLEYSYSRLEKAAEKAFGGDYISNFKAQQKNLQAQALAYQKQADAERSKGKKADEDKIKEFEEAYRDTMDEIADMQGQIAAQMLGTDLTSAARDFAQAWLDAYKEFGNTADAMSDKFKEMIENMMVESLLARTMEKALKPAFDMIDSYEGDFIDEAFWKQVSALAEKGAKDANYGAQTMMRFLEQAGISIRNLGGDLTGIGRDIASASEESINGLAAGINTQNFYISQIHADVARIAASMGGDVALSSVDYTPLIQQSLQNQSQIIRYQAETLAECRTIASRCQEQTETLRRVIIPNGLSTANAKIAVKIIK